MKSPILLVLGLVFLVSTGFWPTIISKIIFGIFGIILIYLYFKFFKLEERSKEERIAIRQNWVRILVTYIATSFIFVGGLGLIALAIYSSFNLETAKDLYLSILPVATSIIAYWFGSR